MQKPNPDEPECPLHDHGTDKVGYDNMRRSPTGKHEKPERGEQDWRAEQIDEQIDCGVCRCGACVDAAAARPGRWRTPIFDDGA
ncbi:hypothetical protein [Burkholderia seminalis]|uniref:hypothetical protein n=1 Tax=Burkholderia seminalis TaxID=488731 RepID=UPI001907F94E|nr:hypothetical protein [Burkholderia seminalis]MBJ9968142.1 hypothetical protein [Burkholderia seminalis]